MKKNTLIIAFCIILLCITLIIIPKNEKTPQFEYDGTVKIAIIDSGISLDAIDENKVLDGYNYVTKTTDTIDTIDHGTAISSIIVGSSSARVDGISQNSELVPLVFKMFHEDGTLETVDSDTLAEIIYDAIDVYECRIINLSLGILEPSEKLEKAILYAEEKEVIVVSSVGNSHQIDSSLVYYPANYETVIGVGSHDENSHVSDFSMRNSSVMVLAQGEGLWYANKDGMRFSPEGTSYSTAIVTAHIAELLHKNYNLTALEIRKSIEKSVIDIHEEGQDFDSGFGIFKGFIENSNHEN